MEYSDLIDQLASKLAHAIAIAEGGLVEGTLPWRIHNPGDLELGDRDWGVDQSKTIYLKADPLAPITDHTDGFSALRRECTAILTGASMEYSPSDTFEAISSRWTGNDNQGAWCKIVTDNLGVQPLDTIVSWIKASTTS
jgi:hypothetical protein